VHPHLNDLERIERNAWADLVRLAPPELASAIGLETAKLGSALFVMAARIPQFQFNFLNGVGLDGDDGACIEAAVQKFRSAGQKKFIVQVPPGPEAPRMEALAQAAGLEQSPLAWAKFIRASESGPNVKTTLAVREIGDNDSSVFGQTAIAGFGMPAPMADWLAAIVGQPRWHAYLSYDSATPVGAGALYVDGDFAWCGIGSTISSARKRGGQSAMLARRIADAASFGAKFVVTETGAPQPGAPAPSYNNILASGFDVAYVRPNWSPGSYARMLRLAAAFGDAGP
jgi:hypothetical protein